MNFEVNVLNIIIWSFTWLIILTQVEEVVLPENTISARQLLGYLALANDPQTAFRRQNSAFGVRHFESWIDSYLFECWIPLNERRI